MLEKSKGGNWYCTENRRGLFKGMVILSREQKKPRACWRFESEIFMLYHNSVLRPGFEATVHVGGVMQTARVTRIYNEEQVCVHK